MSQCVPSWDIENQSPPRPPPPPRLSVRSHSNSTASDVPLYDYEVAELTWENGHVAMHGLGLPCKRPSWEKPRATGTLESIVNQATCTLPHQFSKPPFDNTHNTTITTSATDNLVTWFDHHRRVNTASCAPASHTVTMDALVPSTNSQPDEPSSSHMIGSVVSAPGVFGGSSGTAMINGCSTWVGSCSAVATHDENTRRLGKHAASATHVPTSPEWSSRSQSESGSATFGMDCQQVALDTKGSDHDSVCHSRLQREAGDDDERKKRCSTGKSSVSTKRSRAAAIHNQSERKRRDKINQRMKTLQKLVPNSSKTDKASMLDEVIEYLKQLQAQVHVISRMNMPPAMMLPMAMQQQLQMSMMAPRNMGMGIGMGMGLGLDMNSISRSNIAGVPPVLLPSAFMPAMASWDASASGAERLQAPSTAVMPDPMSAFLACQSQPMTMDAYSMMAAMYQQFHQQQPTASSSKS